MNLTKRRWVFARVYGMFVGGSPVFLHKSKDTDFFFFSLGSILKVQFAKVCYPLCFFSYVQIYIANYLMIQSGESI